jgi:hypothetical protein
LHLSCFFSSFFFFFFFCFFPTFCPTFLLPFLLYFSMLLFFSFLSLSFFLSFSFFSPRYVTLPDRALGFQQRYTDSTSQRHITSAEGFAPSHSLPSFRLTHALSCLQKRARRPRAHLARYISRSRSPLFAICKICLFFSPFSVSCGAGFAEFAVFALPYLQPMRWLSRARRMFVAGAVAAADAAAEMATAGNAPPRTGSGGSSRLALDSVSLSSCGVCGTAPPWSAHRSKTTCPHHFCYACVSVLCLQHGASAECPVCYEPLALKSLVRL